MKSSNGWRLVSREQAEFTEKDARALMALTKVRCDRSVKPRHVALLREHIEAGTFLAELAPIITAYCNEDGNQYRLNGQHTATAVIELAECGRRFSPCVEVMRYHCDTVQDVERLYGLIDRGRARSANVVYQTHLAQCPELSALPAQVQNLLQSGFNVWHWADVSVRNQVLPDTKAQTLVSEYRRLGIAVGDALCDFGVYTREGKCCRRSAVVAAMFATFEKAAGASRVFWQPVASGTGLPSVGDPRAKLRTFLGATVVKQGDSRGQIVGVEEMYRCCLLAWNAWREQRELKYLQPGKTTERPRVR